MRWQDLDLLESIGLTLYERKALATLMVQGIADGLTPHRHRSSYLPSHVRVRDCLIS
jgi:hypothetical protein